MSSELSVTNQLRETKQTDTKLMREKRNDLKEALLLLVTLTENMTESDLDRIIKSWATAYNEEVLQHAQPASINDTEVKSSQVSSMNIRCVVFRCLLMCITT